MATLGSVGQSGLLAAIVAAVSVVSAPVHSAEFRRHHDHILGTSLDLVVIAHEESVADAAEMAILSEIERLDPIFNTYVPTSEIARANASVQTEVSAELIEVLTACEEWRERTVNGLSCRIGAVIDAWREGEEAGAPPRRATMRLLAGKIRRADIALDADSQVVTRADPVVFDTNALAKGYIIDAALDAARSAAPGAEGLLINIGGDVRGWGVGPDEGAWRVGVIAPHQAGENASDETVLRVMDRAVASSGRGARDRVIDGETYGHIISPFDGWPARHALAATVAAPDAMTADALATALMVMPLKRALDLLGELDGVEALIVAEDERRYETAGWRDLLEQRGASNADASPAWPSGFAMTVAFEIPAMDVSDYERPYIAAWIADPERNLVRILMLAGDEERWMEENYFWHRRFGRKAGSLVDAIAGPTRRPGQYMLAWDGLDDAGAPVPPGEYILHLEAAREHGGHQHESVELNIGDSAFEHTRPPGDELGALVVRFGPEQ